MATAYEKMEKERMEGDFWREERGQIAESVEIQLARGAFLEGIGQLHAAATIYTKALTAEYVR